VLVLREVEHMADDEIAALAGLPGETVARLGERAAARLGLALGCSADAALAAYRRWPLAAAPWTADEALARARDARG
jgi:hypothetical protein